MDDTSIGNSQNKEETNGRPTGIAKATVKDSNATDEPVGMVGKILVLEEQDRRERERSQAADSQRRPTQCGPVHTTVEGPNSFLYDSESNNAMGMVGKRLILAQEEADAANAAAIVTSTVDRASAIAPAGASASASAGASAASVLQVSGTNQHTRSAMEGSNGRNSRKNPTPTEPPQLMRQDYVQQNQQVLPGAVAVPGVGERQFGSSAGNNISDPEQQDFVRDNHHDDNHNLGLVEAESVDDLEEPKAIAVPAIESTNTTQSITQKYQFRFAAFAITLLLIGGIFIGSICGAGLCKADDSSLQPTMTDRDMLQAPKMKAALTEILGDSYFDQEEESGDDLEVHLSQFLVATRQRALDWIVNLDPMQLSFDAPNLLQRFALVLFYYQTTRNKPWKVCNPPATDQRSTNNFCYEPDFYNGEVTSVIWGDQWLSDSHECKWAGIGCDETVQSEERAVVEIHLRWNHLNGPLPWEITRLPLLRILRLNNNMLTGALPPRLFSKKAGVALEALLLGENQFSGTIPVEWVPDLLEGNGKLVNIHLNRNTLTGKIPSELGLLAIKTLSLANNKLTGSIPQEIFNQTSLESLFLRKNDLTGTLPSEVGLLTNLQELNLNYTQISGTLPSEIGLANQLQELFLSNTNMQGTIPEELYMGLDNLWFFGLDGCNFTGTISSSVGLFQTTLRHMYLANNNFHGTLPNEIDALALLRELLESLPSSVLLTAARVVVMRQDFALPIDVYALAKQATILATLHPLYHP
ncbi:leucine rich repeat [Seminavis robusta]|uniref:Leucine rich repeat n=1 Tax=Seminavis robusta TaxID=568900 RepID=A0A9N8H0X4_9STRA|nr:leucine rich repeat [Seminavis robusta]|eukprot:Sro7_g006160.1 leucine rich repeat (754) ;mRNA; f:170274-172810